MKPTNSRKKSMSKSYNGVSKFLRKHGYTNNNPDKIILKYGLDVLKWDSSVINPFIAGTPEHDEYQRKILNALSIDIQKNFDKFVKFVDEYKLQHK